MHSGAVGPILEDTGPAVIMSLSPLICNLLLIHCQKCINVLFLSICSFGYVEWNPKFGQLITSVIFVSLKANQGDGCGLQVCVEFGNSGLS